MAKIKEENPRLAREARILRVSMDAVYEVFTTPREQTGLQGITFRFMPDRQQVAHALQVRPLLRPALVLLLLDNYGSKAL